MQDQRQVFLTPKAALSLQHHNLVAKDSLKPPWDAEEDLGKRMAPQGPMTLGSKPYLCRANITVHINCDSHSVDEENEAREIK